MGLLYGLFGIKPTEMWEFYDLLDRNPEVKVSLEIYGQCNNYNYVLDSGSLDRIFIDYVAFLPNKKIMKEERLQREKMTIIGQFLSDNHKKVIYDEVKFAQERFGDKLEIRIYNKEVKDLNKIHEMI